MVATEIQTGFSGLEPQYSWDEAVPVPRVKREAEENYIKGRGSMKECAFTETRQPYTPRSRAPQVKPRCPTRESKENYELNTKGSFYRLLNGEPTPRPKTAPCARVKTEGQETANLSRGGRMKSIVNEYGQYRPTPRVARVKYEGKDNFTVHKGGRMNTILTKYGQGSDNSAVPRVSQYGQQNADLGKGKRMGEILDQNASGKYVGDPQLGPRVKKEGEGNAYIGKGVRMQKIMTSVKPDSPRPVPRVKKEAESNADLGKGMRISYIVHDSKKLPETPIHARGVRSTEAKRIQQFSRGLVGKMMQDAAKKAIVYKPGMQSPHYDIAPTYPTYPKY
ncbi:hypothetical protein SNE40_001296 [Patella caerulea]|uniref:Uncharacterized protein n=1 Tax=Patella caerulea TaxID=87958 RepID=A0AAN8KJ16_PATCE